MGCHTPGSVRRTLHIKHVKHKNISAALISLDDEKASDSAHWAFLYQVFEKFVFKQSSSSYCSQFDIIRPRQHLTDDQQYLARQDVLKGKLPLSLQCHRVTSAGCNRHWETGRVTERHKGGCPLAKYPADDHCELCSVEPDDECHLTPGTFKVGERHPSVMSDHSKLPTSAWSAC